MSERMFYVASWPDKPGFCASSVDEPGDEKENARVVSGWIRQGRQVHRVNGAEMREGMERYGEWLRANPAT